MKINKKTILSIAMVAVLAAGVFAIALEVLDMRTALAQSRLTNETYLAERYEEQTQEIQSSDANTITLEGATIVLGKTTAAEVLEATGLSVDKSSGYYSWYDYENYRYMTKSEIDKEGTLEPVGSGRLYLYDSNKSTDVTLQYASFDYTEETDWHNVTPSYDHCYITGVEIRFTGTAQDYSFSYHGLDETSTSKEWINTFGEDGKDDYESDYSTSYSWKPGRYVRLSLENYTQQGQDLYDCLREVYIYTSSY